MSEKNIPKVTVNTLVKEISQIYVAAIKGDWPLSMIPTPFVWGPPGVGKSAGIGQLSRVIENHTGKKVVMTDIRLLLFSPVDLRGIPVASNDRTLSEWLKPKVFDMDPSKDVVNILFLDELTAAPPSVQAAAYQLTLDHKIGEHKLPDNCIIIGAGNRTTDRSITYRMPNALANRMQHYEVIADFDSWRDWAVQNRVHPLVLGYLSFDNSKFYETDTGSEQVAFATPRSWMFVSDILNIMGDVKDLSVLFNQISGCVGNGVALSFVAWSKKHTDLPEVKDIFCGKKSKYPATMDALYALVMSMIAFVENHEKSGEVTVSELENMAIYATRFPMDYQACLYSNLCQTNSVKKKLLKISLFREWVKHQNIAGVVDFSAR